MATSSSDVLHLQSSSLVSYDGNQLLGTSASQHVVMVTGFDEAVKMLLSSQGIDGGGGAGGEEGPYGVGYSEAVMMYPGSETVQTTTADYLDFSEPTDSLHGPEGVVQYSVDVSHHHEEDECETLNEIATKASPSPNTDTTASATALMLGQTAVLVSEPNKSTLEGFLSGRNNSIMQRVNSSDVPQQVIHVVDMLQTTGPNIFRLVPNPDGTVSFVSFQPQLNRQDQDEEDVEIDDSVQFMQVQTQAVDATTTSQPVGTSFIVPVARQVKAKKLPPGCPSWASVLNDCERIGDSFRGWVETEMNLESVLTYFKQVTHSYWGTRQSPSQSKASTRLMWKSQYVPFDGIPFINASSRAIVMECQYGPRRQSNSKKLTHAEVDPRKVFRQSCPARIYIKKVRKFPEFAVDSKMDKKQLKAAMDDAFHSLKESNVEKMGEDRYYVQLPTEAAHEFHSESLDSSAVECPHRLHPLVSDKLREIVSTGERRLYAIRNMLRRFVEKELFSDSDKPPARHDLTYFPTVNDLQNNIHQAIHDMETGVLPFTSQVDMEMNTSCNESGVKDETTIRGSDGSGSNCQTAHVHKVTVMLCAKPGEGGHHVISQVETVMSDGTVQISSSLPPELAHMISNVPHSLLPLQDTQQNVDGKSVSTTESDIAALGAADIHAICDESPQETFERQLNSVKFSPTVHHDSALKMEDEPETADTDSHFSLDGSCDPSTGGHLVEEDIVEQLCVTEHWRKELGIGSKRFIEDNMPANICRIKRKKLI